MMSRNAISETLLSHKWVLWAHLPGSINNDWSMNGYIKIHTFETMEEVIAIIKMLPNSLLCNCMFFFVKKDVIPRWEENIKGGAFSYKVNNNDVPIFWETAAYLSAGETLSNDPAFVSDVAGITISPKKHFCIVKIWMKNCKHQNPSLIANDLNKLTKNGCLFSAFVKSM